MRVRGTSRLALISSALVFAALVCGEASAAITVRNSTSAATSGAESSLSWPHEVFSGSNRVLIVGLSLETGQATGVMYGTAPMTLVGRHTGGSSHTIELWRLVGPAVGPANIVATFDVAREALGGATSFEGVSQTSPTGDFQGNDGASSTPSVTVAAAVDDLVIDTLFVDVNSLSATPDPSQDQRWNLVNGRLGAGSTEPGAASVVMSWSLSGSEEWTLAAAALQLGPTISGVVFEDADFAGSATGYDGGSNDAPLEGVDVELYDGGTDAYIASTTTDANGNYGFNELPDGSYKVRVRSATIGSGTAAPKGGLNATVPGTWPDPLAEMTWANGAAVYGGQSPTVDDTATADNAGPGDTWAAVSVSGTEVTGVDFGFAYNLIVNTNEDSGADNARSAQGSLRQFIKNANAIGGAGGTTASSSEFRIPTSDPNYNVSSGVFTITPSIQLPDIADTGTTLDASTQGDNTSQTNPGNLGTGGKVGVNQLDLSTVPAPEIEIVGSETFAYGLRFTGSSGTLRGLAIHGFGLGSTGEANVFVADAITGPLIEQNLIGSGAAVFADPGSGFRGWENIYSDGADNGTIRNNLIGFGGTRGILLSGESVNWTIEDNELRDNSLQATGGDGLAIDPGQADVTGNLIVGSASQGVVVSGSTGSTFTDNTIMGNGIGTDSASGNAAGMTFRPTASGHTVEYNEFIGNYGAGLSVNDGATGIKVTRNSFSANGTIIARNLDPKTDQIGIDLNNPTDDISAGTSPFVSLNDAGDDPVANPGGNDLLNYPVLDTALINGPNLELTGWARPGSVIELYVADGDPSGFGEGQTYKLTLTENGTGSGGEDPHTDLDTGPATLYSNPVNGLNQGTDTTNRFRFSFPLPAGVSPGSELTATARDGSNNTSEFGGLVTVAVAPADLELSKSDSPDPAPLDGPMVYTLVVTNNGPGTATGVTVSDVLPASVTLESATPSQGSCSGTTTVTCNLGAIVATGTASVEILVTTTATGTITNNASVTANETDPVPGNNAAAEDTDVVADSAILDVPLTQYQRIHGFVDYTVTGSSLRTQPNGGGGEACTVGPSASASVSGIPATATISAAYLYWAGSGATVDADVTFDGGSITADRTFQGRFSLGANDYEFFGGFEDVTAQVTAKRNDSYSFADLTVDTANPYCNVRAVMAGWSLVVVYADAALSGKTLVLYDGFDIERNGSTSYLLTGIYSADPPEAKTTPLIWEGDADLSGATEFLEFNGTSLSDGLNPVNNVYNSTINSLGSTTSYGMDLDTFDVSGLVAPADTLATTQVSVGPDLVVLNAVVLQVKSNLIAGHVFEDVNYGGGVGRNRATAATGAPTFTVDRPGVTVELYDAGGNFLRTTTTNASGEYGFTGLVDGDYQVRVVNDTVSSSRPGATGAELAVQTFRTDASSGAAVAVPGEVGGDDPTAQDSPANVAMAALGTLTAQSVAPVRITTGIAVPDVDFGFNFDTIVNTGNDGQGSLEQFLLNSNLLTNGSLNQDGLTTGVETSLFMIPSNADPWGRPKDPNFDAGRGVAVIAPTTSLTAVLDADTAIDGGTQTEAVGDTNTAVLGTGGTVGVTSAPLPQLAGPEIEIRDGAALVNGIDIQADDTIVRDVAIYGFGNGGTAVGNIRVGIDATTNFTGVILEDTVLGTAADSFTDPDLAVPGSGSEGANLAIRGADGGILRRSLVGFSGRNGASIGLTANDWTIENNEFRRNGIDDNLSDGVGINDGSQRIVFTDNLFVDNQAAGVDYFASAGDHTLTNNTFDGNGRGGVETAGLRMFGSGSVVEQNVFINQTGSGVLAVVDDPAFPAAGTPATQHKITRNHFSGNGANAIDLQTTLDITAPGDGITLNDGTLLGDSSVPDVCGIVATHGNEGLDTPIIDVVLLGPVTSTVRGRACPGSTVEIYRAVADGDSSDTLGGNDYGEGVEYLATTTAAAGTGLFDIGTVPGLSPGDSVSAIAIDGSNNTSEFATNLPATSLQIVKRAFQSDGTPIANGSTLPAGMPVKILLYVDNPSGVITDVSLQDVLDLLFAYQSGSMQLDNTLVSSVVCPGGVCDEAAIFAQVDGSGTPLGDGDAATPPFDADAGSYDSGTRTIDLGDSGNPSNAQLDLAGNRVWAVVFTITMR